MSRMWSLPHKFDEAFEQMSEADKAAALETLKTSVSICIRKRAVLGATGVTYELIPQWENHSVNMHYVGMDDAYEFHDGNGFEVFIGAPKRIVEDMTAPLADQAGFTEPYVAVDNGEVLDVIEVAVSQLDEASREEINQILNEYPILNQDIAFDQHYPNGDVSYVRDTNPMASITQADLDAAMNMVASSEAPEATPETHKPDFTPRPDEMISKYLYIKALDALAVALTNKGHEWTDLERSLYSEAVLRAQRSQ